MGVEELSRAFQTGFQSFGGRGFPQPGGGFSFGGGGSGQTVLLTPTQRAIDAEIQAARAAEASSPFGGSSLVRSALPGTPGAPPVARPQPPTRVSTGSGFGDTALGLTLGVLRVLCRLGVLPDTLCAFPGLPGTTRTAPGVTNIFNLPRVVRPGPTPVPPGGGGGGININLGGPAVPNVPVPSLEGGPSGLGIGFGDIIDLFQRFTGSGSEAPQNLPGGAPVPMIPGNGMMGSQMCAPGGQLFRAPSQNVTARPASLVMACNPATGKPTFFRHVGQPVLFSGDLQTCKRVEKVARRAKRAAGRRGGR